MSDLPHTIGDYAKVISGFAFKSKDFVQSGVPVVKIANIQHERVTWDKVQYLSDEFLKVPERYHVCEGDIMISLTGSHISQPNSVVGRVAKYRYSHVALLNQRAARIVIEKPDCLDRDFLYYFLRQKKVTYELAINAGGSANQANISPKDVERTTLPKIDLSIQKRISETLSAYDDLIENNRRRIALLEESARLLYREWFVHLRFPGYATTKIIDGVPEGWRKGTVSDLGHVVTGKTPSKKVEANFGGNIPFIKTPDMHGNAFIFSTEESLSELGEKSQKNKTLPPYSVLVSCIGTVGVVSMNAFPSQTNQQINSVIPNSAEWAPYVFFALKEIKPFLEAIGGGVTMANVNKTKFSSVPVTLPIDEVVSTFYSKVKPLFNLIEKLQSKNIKLAEARDILLPRLMDGRVEI